MEYEAGNEEAAEIQNPTRMYFERWGLLAPPPEKASFQKNITALLFPRGTIPHQLLACKVRRAGVLACKKLSLDSTRHSGTQ